MKRSGESHLYMMVGRGTEGCDNSFSKITNFKTDSFRLKILYKRTDVIFAYCTYRYSRWYFNSSKIASVMNHSSLNHRSLVPQYGEIDIVPHWLMWWFVAWRHQAITSTTNVGLSLLAFCGIHLGAISKQASLKLLSHLPEANEQVLRYFKYACVFFTGCYMGYLSKIIVVSARNSCFWLVQTWHEQGQCSSI